MFIGSNKGTPTTHAGLSGNAERRVSAAVSRLVTGFNVIPIKTTGVLRERDGDFAAFSSWSARWKDKSTPPKGPRRRFSHGACGGIASTDGVGHVPIFN